MEKLQKNVGNQGIPPPVFGVTPPSGSTPPASMEFADGGCQEGNRQRPDPDPPYGMPPLWKTPAWVPGGQMGTGPDSRLSSSGPPPHTPAMQTFPEPRLTGGNSQQLGFRPNPSPTSTWELGPACTTWDHPSLRMSPQSQGQDPGCLFKLEPPVFDDTEAHNWVTRVEYYFNHILLPDMVYFYLIL